MLALKELLVKEFDLLGRQGATWNEEGPDPCEVETKCGHEERQVLQDVSL